MFLKLLDKHIKYGQLDVSLPDGKHYHFGSKGPSACWSINSFDAIRRIAKDWEYELGETYISGAWDVTRGELRDLLGILRSNFNESLPAGLGKMIMFLKIFPQQWNRISRSFSNIHHHYDRDVSLFRAFLDDDMHYSCAYFEQQGQELEQAQQAKCDLIARKLLLQPGQQVLDIGCGWGSLAMYLAENHNVNVTGITLSKEQLQLAQTRASKRNLDDKIDFKLVDYRELSGTFDRIVSVGMFEHVGRPYYGRYFRAINNLLKPDGHALIHTIGRSGVPKETNPWIRKHIFPGGYIPALSEMTSGIENSQLIVTDIEVLRQHYALTLAEWYKRFYASRTEIQARYGEHFYRLWEFYLNICEIAFRYSDLVVFQVQLAKTNDALPITRDYMYRGHQ